MLIELNLERFKKKIANVLPKHNFTEFNKMQPRLCRKKDRKQPGTS